MTTTPRPPAPRPTPARPTTPPKTPIQQALASLTLNLNDELTRYRQSRSGAVSSPRGGLFRRQRRSPDLITLTQVAPPQTGSMATPEVPTVVATPGVPQPQPPQPQPATAMASPPSTPSLPSVGNPPSPPVVQGTELALTSRTLADTSALPRDYLTSTEVLLNSGAPTPTRSEPEQGEPDYHPPLWKPLMTPLGIGSLLLLLLGSASLGYVVTSPQALSHLPWLGASRTDVDPAATAEPGADSTAIAPTVTDGATSASPTSPDRVGIGPDLSQGEFRNLDLGSLSTLAQPDEAPTPAPALTPESASASSLSSTLEPAPASTTPAPATTEPSPGTAPTTVAPPATAEAASPTPTTPTPTTTPVQAVTPTAPVAPVPLASQPPQPLAVAQPVPQPQPTAQPAAPPAPLTQVPVTPTPAPAPAAAPSYYVVASYTGDQSLTQARTAVSDAYVRNFPSGAKIQLGAFSQAGAAQGLVQQLQRQGITAQVYQP